MGSCQKMSGSWIQWQTWIAGSSVFWGEEYCCFTVYFLHPLIKTEIENIEEVRMHTLLLLSVLLYRYPLGQTGLQWCSMLYMQKCYSSIALFLSPFLFYFYYLYQFYITYRPTILCYIYYFKLFYIFGKIEGIKKNKYLFIASL